jgi:hypothetical protein
MTRGCFNRDNLSVFDYEVQTASERNLVCQRRATSEVVLIFSSGTDFQFSGRRPSQYWQVICKISKIGDPSEHMSKNRVT